MTLRVYLITDEVNQEVVEGGTTGDSFRWDGQGDFSREGLAKAKKLFDEENSKNEPKS